MTGYLAIGLALVATGIAVFAFFLKHAATMAGRDNRRLFDGQIYYYMSTGFISAAVLYLLELIFSEQYQYAYVYAYSSKDLSLVYKISAVWAGQEGSFLLWAFFHCLIGCILIRTKTMPTGAAVVYGIIQFLLILIILVKSPFMMLPDTCPDGLGLNPLLQDPWMVIHPPLVLLGYAGLAVPFSYAVGGLLSNEHRNWIHLALAWALLAWGVLGAGIFIGGYWAYKVLGWGGYWGWDPVENSSLIPWLVCGALVHLLLLTLKRAAAVKAAYLAAISTFALVLYGTFLTRSGILSNFSTHSFSNEGMGGLLAAIVMLVLAASLIILIMKWPELPQGTIYDQYISCEFMVVAGTLTLAGMAAVILIGTSTPLVTMLLGNPQNIQTSFYNAVTLPIAGVLALLLAFVSVIRSGGSRSGFIRDCIRIIFAALAATAALLLFGRGDILPSLILGLAIVAFFAALRGIKRGFQLSVSVIHAGVAVMIIGVIVSSTGSRSVMTSFNTGETKQLLGRSFTYTGSSLFDGGKAVVQGFSIGKTAKPIQAITKLGKDGRPVLNEPAIYRSFFGDEYIAPSLNQNLKQGKELELAKGKQVSDERLTIKLIQYGMNQADPQKMGVYALLEVQEDERKEEIRPELVYTNGEFKTIPVLVLDKYQISLTSLNLAEERVMLEVYNSGTLYTDKVEVEVSHKPFIALVWLGTGVLTAGTLWAACRRWAGCNKLDRSYQVM